MRVRLVDLGTVPYLESQSTYHAIAYAMAEGDPDTISIMSPDRPYVSIGFHQEVEKEIDLEYCRQHGIPVIRREVGGGAVYLDGGQVFLHFVFHKEHMPRQVEEVYKRFIDPVVATYRAIGIDASHRPLNDIVAGARKIGGTGIASIGQAMVVAGSLMFDFDSATMARSLKVSSEKMRDKVYQSLQDYMTTIRRELAEPPDREAVKAILKSNYASMLGVDLEPGELTAKEKRWVRTINRRFSSARWLHRKGGLPRKDIKIKGGLRVAEAEHKAPGGLVRVTARLAGDVIDDLTLSGDFTFQPAEALARLEAALRGCPLDRDALARAAAEVYAAAGVQAPGLAPGDVAEAVMKLPPDAAASR